MSAPLILDRYCADSNHVAEVQTLRRSEKRALTRIATRLILSAIAVVRALPAASFVEPVWPQLRVTVERQTYKLDDWIELELEILNRGPAPVFFCKEMTWDLAGTLDYVVFDKQGDPLRRLMFFHEARFSLLLDDNRKLVKLDPGESLKTLKKLPIFGLVDGPGEYVLRVRYDAQTDLHSFMGLKVWNRASGPLLASLSFDVVP